MPLERGFRPAALRHVQWLIDLGEALGANVEEAKRQIRMANGDYDRGAIEKAYTRLATAAAHLEPSIRLSLGRALKDLGREVDRVKRGGAEVAAAAKELESARRAVGSGRFREAREHAESCVALLGIAGAVVSEPPARFLNLPAHPVGRGSTEDDGPSDEDLKEFIDLKREIEHSIAGIRKSGLGAEAEARGLAHATSAWFSGDHPLALEEVRACAAGVERKLESLTPSVRCTIVPPALGMRSGKPVKLGIELSNRAAAPAADVRVTVSAGEFEKEFNFAVLKSGGLERSEFGVSFLAPGDVMVTAQAKYRRVFDAREYESVVVEILTVEDALTAKRKGGKKPAN